APAPRSRARILHRAFAPQLELHRRNRGDASALHAAGSGGARRPRADPARRPAVSAGLVKILTVFVRRPDLTREAFRSHYEKRHVPRAMEHVAHFGFRKYVRNHVVGPDGVEPGFDCLTEFFFRSLEDAGSSVGFMSSPEGRWFAEDELNFLDMSPPPSLELAESVVAGPPRGVDPKGVRKQALVLARAPGKSAEEFSRAAREHARTLARANAGRIHRLMLDLAVQG